MSILLCKRTLARIRICYAEKINGDISPSVLQLRYNVKIPTVSISIKEGSQEIIFRQNHIIKYFQFRNDKELKKLYDMYRSSYCEKCGCDRHCTEI